MNLQQVNEALDHAITGGSEYLWNCYPDARTLDYETDYGHASVTYSTKTREIYEASAESKDSERPYRWLNPDFKDALEAESQERGIDNASAWDDVKWIDLETEDDFLEKAQGVCTGDWFDERIQVPVNLSDADFLRLAKMAHERDITFNEMVCEALRSVIKGLQNEETTCTGHNGCDDCDDCDCTT